MLNIFYGRENIDKDRFMFDRIGETLKRIRANDRASSSVSREAGSGSDVSAQSKSPRGIARRVLLIVPEQYTLQTERNAFEYLDVPGFLDFEVLSLTSFGRRVLSEAGGGEQTLINRYGKFMLISGLLRKNKQELFAFQNLEGSPDFIDKMSGMIAELKNFNITAPQLRDILDDIESDDLLKRKLRDVAVIYDGYEAALRDAYVDAADYLKLFTSKIAGSEFVAETEIWLSAFDYLSPAATDAVTELVVRAPAVNLVLTAEPGTPFFRLTNALAEEAEKRAQDAGARTSAQPIGEGFAHNRPEPIARIERELFFRSRGRDGSDASGGDAIRFVAAANYYAEAETAAARISELVRDEGLRYRDALVLCNDVGERTSVIKRVFARYGLPIFIDQRRSVEHNPAFEYILALLSVVSGGWSYEAVFRLLKTGLTEIEREEWEELENYVLKYKIRGNLWKRDFAFGFSEYARDEMDGFNETRRKLAQLIDVFEEPYRRAETVRQRTELLQRFLEKEATLPEAAERLAASLDVSREPEYAEYVAEMLSIWNVIADVFDQLRAALGDMRVSADEYAGILRTGFSSVRMGILPPSPDRILVGTMRRTRIGEAKAIFVLGANDGILPMFDSDDMILNEDERARLSSIGYELGKRDDNTFMEEQLAIYRNLSKPQRLLHVSCSVSDGNGKDVKPSIIFDRLRGMFPRVPTEKDILNDGGDPLRLVQYRDETMSHLTENLRRWVGGEPLPDVWKDVYLRFRSDMGNIRRGLTFRNRRERIDEKFVAALYGGAAPDHQVSPIDDETPALITSPSALERFSRCPFSFFMDRGIRVEERRVFEIDSRNTGDIYHETLMRYGAEMIGDGLPPMDERSAWRTVTEAESAALVGRIYDEAVARFKEGLFRGGGFERYKSDRIKRIASDVAWILTEQVRAGAISDMMFEAAFDKGGVFPPIDIEKDGKRVRVKGRIDRLDILEGDCAKIIDYKSGTDAFSREDVLGGWQLQLMLYLLAVRDRYKPAGVFYFKIDEARVEDTGKDDVAERIMRNFKPDGICANDPRIVAAIGQPVKSADPDEFEAMQESVSSLVTDLCGKLLSGNIDAKPMTAKKIKAGASNRPMTACTYCSYRGVCNFDRAFA
ncbi:MAG: exodeoxyribonuclease V subunit gamma [Clostridiales Family XIII bacterium]|jgi:ATP-dependent helicase/nuclease subunit B|nr:exodeoxyribonuclease V subunit gamma [Clostridiales Family XIII bacterium]